MRVHVAVTPAEAAAARVGVVVDVLRATSTMARALVAVAPTVLARSFSDPHAGLTARTPGLSGGGEDIAFCACASVRDVVPRLAGRDGVAAEIVAA